MRRDNLIGSAMRRHRCLTKPPARSDLDSRTYAEASRPRRLEGVELVPLPGWKRHNVTEVRIKRGEFEADLMAGERGCIFEEHVFAGRLACCQQPTLNVAMILAVEAVMGEPVSPPLYFPGSWKIQGNFGASGR
jgi:hypothetical protein